MIQLTDLILKNIYAENLFILTGHERAILEEEYLSIIAYVSGEESLSESSFFYQFNATHSILNQLESLKTFASQSKTELNPVLEYLFVTLSEKLIKPLDSNIVRSIYYHHLFTQFAFIIHCIDEQ